MENKTIVTKKMMKISPAIFVIAMILSSISWVIETQFPTVNAQVYCPSGDLWIEGTDGCCPADSTAVDFTYGICYQP